MNNSKVVSSIQEAIKLAGLKDGMTISFHHHLRNGDYVLNMVMEAIAGLGIQDLNVNASSVFDVHEPLIDHIKNHVVTGLEADYIGGVVANMENPPAAAWGMPLQTPCTPKKWS